MKTKLHQTKIYLEYHVNTPTNQTINVPFEPSLMQQ